MKKSFSKRILVVLVMLVMASGAIFAATTSNLIINGTVAATLSISLNSGTTALAIDAFDGVSDATNSATFISNTAYKVTVINADATAGLSHASLATIPYSILFTGGTEVDSTAMPVSGGTPTEVYSAVAATPQAGTTAVLTIDVDSADGPFATGSGYSDTIIFEISAN